MQRINNLGLGISKEMQEKVQRDVVLTTPDTEHSGHTSKNVFIYFNFKFII